jgi:hypothetical protein
MLIMVAVGRRKGKCWWQSTYHVPEFENSGDDPVSDDELEMEASESDFSVSSNDGEDLDNDGMIDDLD